MALYILRIGKSKQYYKEIAYIFGLNYYKRKSEGEDDFSKKLIYFYKYGNDIDHFVDQIVDLYELRFKKDSIKFDYITLYPTRTKDGLNSNMVNLAKTLSVKLNIPYNQVLRRNKDITPNHELDTFDKRADNIKESIGVVGDVVNKNVFVLDNTSITGISMIDATNILLANGAKNVVCICLGLSIIGKEGDWNDLNKTLKFSRIVEICKTPFVKKETREEWRKKQLQN